MQGSMTESSARSIEHPARHWKVGFFVLLGMLLLSNVFWFSAMLDAGLSGADVSVKLDESEHESVLLGDLLIDSHRESSQKQIMAQLSRLRPELSLVKTNDIVAVDGVDFVFVNDRLVAVD